MSATESTKQYTTLDHVTQVEGHDDLYRGHRASFLESVLSRSLPNTFHQFLNTWPTAKVKMSNWNEDNFIYAVTVRYEHWTMVGDFDGETYWTDKQTFCDQLDAFCKGMADWFLKEEDSGRPWWNDGEKSWAMYAHHMIGERRFKGITAKLAEIRLRGGRYQWHLIPDKYKRTDWDVTEHKQGHSQSLNEAKAEVMKAWKGPQ